MLHVVFKLWAALDCTGLAGMIWRRTFWSRVVRVKLLPPKMVLNFFAVSASALRVVAVKLPDVPPECT